ncbi:MAG: extensin [Hyphomicrobiales bacterium]|nr:extensin [Hyphomicrobiales bacterium]
MVFASFAIGLAMSDLCIAQETVVVPQIRPKIETAVQQTEPKKPKRIYQSACPALMKGEIEAKILPPIIDDECGERSPLALKSILSIKPVRLSSTVKTNCRVASAMVEWVKKLNAAAEVAYDSSVSVILSGNGYQCRRRNNLPDGKISEHGFANAIDIMGFKLKNGDDILIKRDWDNDPEAPTVSGLFLRTVHKAACNTFTTVLGPESNQFHSDHFHFDLGCHGKTCTYLLCE